MSFNERLSKKTLMPFLMLLLILSSVLWLSCNEKPDSSTEPNNLQQDLTALTKENPAIQAVIAVQERHSRELMQNSEIVGTAAGLTDDGRPALLVLTKTDIKTNALNKGMPSPVPDVIENIPVQTIVTGEIKIFKDTPRLAQVEASHTSKQTLPIKLGTSGGWRYDLANGYCCGGTLGSLVTDGTDQYILSNWHVLYSDIVSGGNSRIAQAGDPVLQPGLIDVSCTAGNGQDVANILSPSIGGSLPNANVDAGIAKVIAGRVDATGTILDIGTISATTIAAAINQAVKKSGRTSALTKSKIQGLNGTIKVSYENECAGGTAFTKTYTGQIIIRNMGSSFLRAGDSGSLMVQDVAINPKAIGLLYAGSNTTAIANPINEVLNFFSGKTGKTFKMVGK